VDMLALAWLKYRADCLNQLILFLSHIFSI
jgi:hypothetical protein